jgi:bifunctional DNA-binding transcriptional regulator/antitoxin component of YhaV-PrlF toxin-antitoxin module
MMFVIDEIGDTKEFIEKQMNLYLAQLEKEITGYKCIWLSKLHDKNGLTFIRGYSDDNLKKQKEQEQYKDLVSKWVEESNIKQNDYIDVTIFGNGIRFMIFIDVYNVMSEE